MVFLDIFRFSHKNAVSVIVRVFHFDVPICTETEAILWILHSVHLTEIEATIRRCLTRLWHGNIQGLAKDTGWQLNFAVAGLS